jgi:hypothetical protein
MVIPLRREGLSEGTLYPNGSFTGAYVKLVQIEQQEKQINSDFLTLVSCLKSLGVHPRTGSTPVPGTKEIN